MKYKSNNNIVYSCKYHVVWCPKYRRKVLIDDVEARLKELVEQICRENQFDLLEMEVMPDQFKHLTTKLPTLWTNSYFVSTVGGAPLSVIKQYIDSQKTSQRQ